MNSEIQIEVIRFVALGTMLEGLVLGYKLFF